MKKILIPFCALALFSTQVPAANAASVDEVAIDESILKEAHKLNLDQYEGFYLKAIEQLSNEQGVDFENFYKKLTITKKTLDKLLNGKLDEGISKTIEENKDLTNNQSANKNTKVVEKEVVKEKAPTTPETNETTKKPVQNSQQPKQNNSGYYQAPSKATTNNQQSNNNQQQVVKPSTPTTQNTTISDFEQQVVNLTNAERTKAGLAPLKIYSPLMDVAEAKSLDMAKNNYFSHTSPTYGSPFDQIKAAGISYRAAGENIAQGQRTPQQVVQAWMDSPGHRQNIMNASYTHIGVGFVENGYYWTQQFVQL